MKKIHLNLSVFVSGVMLLLGLVTFIASYRMKYWSGYGPGEGFVSSWSSGLLVLASAVSLVQSLMEQGLKLSDVLPKGAGLKNLLVTWGAILLFLIAVPWTGFIVASVVMMALLYSRGYNYLFAGILAVTVTLACYFIFKSLLGVPLSVNSLGW